MNVVRASIVTLYCIVGLLIIVVYVGAYIIMPILFLCFHQEKKISAREKSDDTKEETTAIDRTKRANRVT